MTGWVIVGLVWLALCYLFAVAWYYGGGGRWS